MLPELFRKDAVTVSGIVEKFDPRKPSALSRKRDALKSTQESRQVRFQEISLEEVKTDAVEFGLATEVLYQIKAGKEASIHLALWKDHPIILKVYRLWKTSHASKERGTNAPGQMEALAAKEFDVLWKCYQAGVHVPTPIGRVGHYITMRFIGDGTDPALQLKDIQIDEPERALDQIFDDYLLMYRDAKYVHGDFSCYNILWWQNRPWIIDVPQAAIVGPWTDMRKAESLLYRDIKNVLSYFKRYYGIHRDSKAIRDTFLSEYIPSNLENYDEDVGGWIQ